MRLIPVVFCYGWQESTRIETITRACNTLFSSQERLGRNYIRCLGQHDTGFFRTILRENFHAGRCHTENTLRMTKQNHFDWQRKWLKIDKLNCCVKSILSIFHDFNDLQRKCAFVVVFWHKLDRYSTAEKTHPRVTDQHTWKCGNYYTHKFSSKTFYFVQNNRNGSVQLHPSLAGKYHKKCNLR